ncbi:MAG: hypothetical protein RLZZ585_1133 [Bacteroidota bacterium]|jgi:hypothetical protein
MKIILLIFSWTLCFLVFSQELTLVETYVSPTPIDTWSIDGQNNLLVVSENNIQKKAINGDLKFNQTFKSLGNIQCISPINAMKILLFSDVQQSVAIIDNTLSQQGDIIDLSDIGFSNVIFICASNRPNLIWVFDQFRSSLNLVDFQKNQILQSIQNVETKGNTILEIKEYQDHLYVLFSDGQMNRYDFLLNFSGSYNLENCRTFGFWNQQIVCLDTNAASLRFVLLEMKTNQRIPDWHTLEMLNKTPITSFIIQGNLLGLQKGNEISIFSIKY